MIQAPEKLFQKASSLGFICSTHSQEHRIVPADPLDSWQLVYKSGHWTLLVNGVPQINFRYSEVSNFLERRAQVKAQVTVLSA